MDPFARFRQKLNEKTVRRLPEELVRGKLYVATKIERKLSDFKAKDGSEVYNMIVYFRGESTNCYVYMGSDYNNPTSEEVEAFNSLISDKKNPSIAFYGYQGRSKVMDLIPHGEGVDESRMGSCSSSETALKRSSSGASGSPSPSKMPSFGDK